MPETTTDRAAAVGPDTPPTHDPVPHDPGTAKPVDPEALFKVASGFMAAKHLFAAAELGLFARLGEGPATLEDLTARLGIGARTTRITADSMVALGFVERSGDRYRNGAIADAYLADRGAIDLRPFLRFWDRISYANWATLAQSLRTGVAAKPELTPEEGEIFATGVEAVTAGSAHALAEAPELEGRRRLLDVGGGTGSFLVAALARHPELSGTLVEVEPVLSVAREAIAAGPVARRVDVVGADASTDPLPTGHDAVLIANVAHLLSPEANRAVLRHVREASEPGTQLLLVDFWTDASHTDPPFAALMAGEFALFSDDGDVYSEQEVHEWLADTGWKHGARRSLAGPQSLIPAVAV
ncbi:MAG TPA: methyltransferase [Solirubrobacteraceae bacterium]